MTLELPRRLWAAAAVAALTADTSFSLSGIGCRREVNLFINPSPLAFHPLFSDSFVGVKNYCQLNKHTKPSVLSDQSFMHFFKTDPVLT